MMGRTALNHVDEVKLCPKHGTAMYMDMGQLHTPMQCAECQREQYAAALSGQIQNQPDYKALYLELLYAVGNAYPGESRHQTVLRYIRKAEQPSGDACAVDNPTRSEIGNIAKP